jgi:hypothetical protein
MQRVQLPYPGGKGRLAPRIVSFLPRRGRTYLEPFAGRGNLFWEAVQQGLKFDRWWLNDLQTHTFLEAIKSHGHDVEVPVRSRRVFEYLRDAYKRGDVMATLLAPHICYSGGLYESGVKGGSGCGDDDGGGSAAGFQRTLRQCHRILHETEPQITGLDWTRLRLEKLTGDDVVVLDPPYAFPLNMVKVYSDSTVDYEQLVDVLLRAKFRWLLCGYPHPILHRLGTPIWARQMQLLCVRVKPGGEERSECVWANYDPESQRSQRFLPASVKGQIKVIADAASLSFTALDARIDSGLEQVAKDFTALVPFLLEMHRRLSAPGRRTDLRKGAPKGLTWTEWVESKRHKLGRGLRSIQYLLKGRTESSLRRQTLAETRANLATDLRSVTTEVPPETPMEIATAMSHLVLDMRSNGRNTPGNKKKLERLAVEFLRLQGLSSIPTLEQPDESGYKM